MITADQKDKIIEMWEQGMSGSKIGDNLNLTRNSVIGFVNRLKRSGHVFKRDEKDQHKKRVIEERKIREEKFAQKNKEIISTTPPKNIPVEKIPVLPTRLGGIELVDLKRTSCRFIISGEDPVTRYCGDEQNRGAYCEYHYKICYYPARGNLEKLISFHSK